MDFPWLLSVKTYDLGDQIQLYEDYSNVKWGIWTSSAQTVYNSVDSSIDGLKDRQLNLCIWYLIC